ncbi:hypothetical protein V9T40_005771 [Parthenolecanium corni]|uniref:Serpin domain-containing protein n=1 Tax=Parthenolecanium corni TaxID=536013 RepID=A0AAN9TX77_9HEMI
MDGSSATDREEDETATSLAPTKENLCSSSASEEDESLEKTFTQPDILRATNRNKAYIHKFLGDCLNSVTVDNSNRVYVGLSLIMAGGIFVQEGYPIKPSYIENAKSIYNNEVIAVNFEDTTAASRKINQWVSEKTNGKISSIVDPSLDPLTRVIITGTLYFNGNWEYPFIPEATKWQKFYLGSNGKADKRSVQVEMMVNQAEIPYYEDRSRGLHAIGMPYKNKEFYMYIVLPKFGVEVQNATNSMTPKYIETIVEKSKMAEVFYVIPKMKLEAEYDLRHSLETLNAKSLFSPTNANFTDIAEGIYASQIIHKVTLDVNEIGTIATTATITNINRGGYVNFRADRPFFFFIYNVKVGTMAFWGKVQKPTPYK